MDFQVMYDQLQAQIKNKIEAINAKKNEIMSLEAEVHKLQGASEMVAYISGEMEKAQEETKTETESKVETDNTKQEKE